MLIQKFISFFQNRYRQMSGSTIDYSVTCFHDEVAYIHELRQGLAGHSDNALKDQANLLRQKMIQTGLDHALIMQSFALTAEAIKRTLQINVHDEQLIGGLVLTRGKLAEMPTGEGKTLTAVLPACCHALGGQGVHILTFNDYLAHRDVDWMGPVYRFLGFSVKAVQTDMTPAEKRAAYAADITYATAFVWSTMIWFSDPFTWRLSMRQILS